MYIVKFWCVFLTRNLLKIAFLCPNYRKPIYFPLRMEGMLLCFYFEWPATCSHVTGQQVKKTGTIFFPWNNEAISGSDIRKERLGINWTIWTLSGEAPQVSYRYVICFKNKGSGIHLFIWAKKKQKTTLWQWPYKATLLGKDAHSISSYRSCWPPRTEIGVKVSHQDNEETMLVMNLQREKGPVRKELSNICRGI